MNIQLNFEICILSESKYKILFYRYIAINRKLLFQILLDTDRFKLSIVSLILILM